MSLSTYPLSWLKGISDSEVVIEVLPHGPLGHEICFVCVPNFKLLHDVVVCMFMWMYLQPSSYPGKV